MESNLIKIEIDLYRRCNNLSNDSYEFGETYSFDEECGLTFHHTMGHGERGYFYFKLKDEHKYFLGKIKYGI